MFELELALNMLEMNPTIDEEHELWLVINRELETMELK